MKVDWTKEREANSILHWGLLVAITKATEGKTFEEILGESFDTSTLDVRLTVNGSELPIEHVFERLQGQLDYMVEKKARQLIDGRIGELSEELDDVLRTITDTARKALKDRLGDLVQEEEW